jgi:hypothetical protein
MCFFRLLTHRPFEFHISHKTKKNKHREYNRTNQPDNEFVTSPIRIRLNLVNPISHLSFKPINCWKKWKKLITITNFCFRFRNNILNCFLTFHIIYYFPIKLKYFSYCPSYKPFSNISHLCWHRLLTS